MIYRNLLILALATTCCSLAKAQTFNRTYQLPGKRMYGSSIALLDSLQDKEIVFSSYGLDTFGGSFDVSNLVKTDSNGVVITAARIDSSYGIEKVTETYDNHIIHASQYGSSLVVTKYDASLTVVWSLEIPHNQSNYVHNFWNYVDIEVVRDTLASPGHQESYYLAYSTGPVNTAYNHDLNIVMCRITESGTLVWKKTYYDSDRSNYPTGDSYTYRAYSLTSLPSPLNPGSIMFAIAGTRRVLNPSLDANLFCFLVDENGLQVSDLTIIDVPYQEPHRGDILWDGDSLVISYIGENIGIPSLTGVSSGVGIVKTDALLQNYRNAFFWEKCENYGNSITLTRDSHYLIGGWVSYCTLAQNEPTPMFLKIDRHNFGQIFYKRYNINRISEDPGGYHRTNDAGFHFLLPAVHTNGYNQNYPDVRMIKTLQDGSACGSEDITMDSLHFSPDTMLIRIDFDEDEEHWIHNPTPTIPRLKETDCKRGGFIPDYYSVLPVGLDDKDIKERISLYPTILRKGSPAINLTFNSETGHQLRIEVYNRLGQLIYQTNTVIDGTSGVAIPSEHLGSGLNTIKIIQHGEPALVSKVMVLK